MTTTPPAPAWQLPRGLAIVTRYLGPTDCKGSRIVATCRRDSETVFRAVVSYDSGLDSLDAHYQGALACLAKIQAQNDCLRLSIQSVGAAHDCYVFITKAD
jgi:hypothetical protein